MEGVARFTACRHRGPGGTVSCFGMDREVEQPISSSAGRRDDDRGADRGGPAPVLIPLPTAADDNQRKNAEVLTERARQH